MSVEIRTEGMHDIIDANAILEKVAGGFLFTEGIVGETCRPNDPNRLL